jgi:hypothetical protein
MSETGWVKKSLSQLRTEEQQYLKARRRAFSKAVLTITANVRDESDCIRNEKVIDQALDDLHTASLELLFTRNWIKHQERYEAGEFEASSSAAPKPTSPPTNVSPLSDITKR